MTPGGGQPPHHLTWWNRGGLGPPCSPGENLELNKDGHLNDWMEELIWAVLRKGCLPEDDREGCPTGWRGPGPWQDGQGPLQGPARSQAQRGRGVQQPGSA